MYIYNVLIQHSWVMDVSENDDRLIFLANLKGKMVMNVVGCPGFPIFFQANTFSVHIFSRSPGEQLIFCWENPCPKTGLSLKMMREKQKGFPKLHPGVGHFFLSMFQLQMGT